MIVKIYDSDRKLVDRLYQWDVNRHITLSIDEMIEPVESDRIYFHFSNSHTEEAFSVKAIKSGDRDYEAMIPNELFICDDTIFMYIFRDDGSDGRITVGEVKLPITARSMPYDYVLKDSPGVIRIANGLVAVGNVVYLAKDGIPFGEGAEAAPDVGFGATGDATTMLDGTAAAKVGNAEQRVPFNGWNYWQETNDDVKASSTVTATPTADCLLLACVMHRNENVSIAGDGWTKIVDSVPATYGTDYTQWITVWSKNVQRGQHEVTVEQSASARMSLKTIALYDASALTVVTNSLINDDPYTPPAATGKRRLYLISSISSSSTVDETYIATDTGELDLRKANEKRFIAFYCYEPDKSASLKFKYNLSSFEAGEQNILILDVEEVD